MTCRNWLVVADVATFMTLAQASQARAANTITFDAQQPVGGTGQINATGTYNLDAGCSLVNITLYCAPKGGGAQSSSTCSANNGAWSGVIAHLSADDYNCWAVMIYSKGGTNQTPVQTAVVVVTVQ